MMGGVPDGAHTSESATGEATAGTASTEVKVVLLNWRDRERTARCRDAVLASRGVRVDVLVVDNGSGGDDAAWLRERVGEDRLLALFANRGYAGGMNAGLAFWRAAPSSEPVLVLTPDATVEPDTLRLLVAELDRDPEVGIVGPLVVHARGGAPRVSAGGLVDQRRVLARPNPEPLRDHPYDVDWIDGCCMLVRRDLLGSVTFDERFFLYFDETDFCCRAKKAGWRVRVVPGAAVDHPKAPGTLPPHYFYYMVRNRYLFWRLNYGVGAFRVAGVVAWLTLRIWAAAAWSMVRRRPDTGDRLRDARLQLRGAWTGTRDHLRGRYGPMATPGGAG